MHSWSGAGISVGTAPAMQAMWCIMYRIRQSLTYLYNLASYMLGTVIQCYGELKTINCISMVLIYVETNWPGNWFEWQYLVIDQIIYNNEDKWVKGQSEAVVNMAM